MQSILETFINQKSFKNADDKKRFLERKLHTRYAMIDTLLNTYNKDYFGVIQQANSDELIMGCKSVETVFKVTVVSVATVRHKCAESRLHQRANKDDLYFPAYLTDYPMMYIAENQQEIQMLVRVRDYLLSSSLHNTY